MKKLINLILLLLLSIALGCGACGGGGGSGSGEDDKAPAVESTSPISEDKIGPLINSVNAISENKLQIKFSEALDEESSIKTDNYIVSSDLDSLTIDSVELENDNETVTISLQTNMQYNTNYSCFVKNVKDANGNAINSITKDFEGRGSVLATFNNLPNSLTNITQINAEVTGEDIYAYKYKIDANDWGSEREVSTLISKTGLTEGSHTIKIIGKDSLGNWQPENASTNYTWIIDTTPPVPAFDNLPLNITTENNINITVLNAFSYKYKINTEDWSEELNGTITRLDLEDGNYEIKVFARDLAGNWQNEADAVSYSWKINTTTPVAELSGLPASSTNIQTANIFVSGNDLTNYKYNIDNSGWSIETDIATSISLASLSEGNHSIKVIAKNNAGVWQEEALATSYSWTIDITAPVASFTQVPNNPSSLAIPVFRVGGTDVVNYKYKIDGGSWSNLLSTATQIPLNALSEDNHTIEIIGADALGNIQSEASSATHSWTIDLTPPVANFISASLPESITNSQSESLQVSSTDITAYRYKFDSEDWSNNIDISNPNIIFDSSALTEGSHQIKIIGRDNAGNWQNEANATLYNWSIDITPPNVTLNNLPGDPTSSSDIDITVSGADSVEYQYSVDGSTWETSQITDTITITGLSENNHTIEVKGVDEAGNVQTTATTHSWVIDQTAATAVLNNLPVQFSNETTTNITVSGTDVIAYKYDIDNSGWSNETTTAQQINLSGLAETAHNIKVIAKDSAGNWQSESSATSYSWNIDTTAPTSEISGYPLTPTNVPNVIIAVSGTDVIAYKYNLNGSGWSDEISIDTDIDLNLTEGSYDIQVIGKDISENWQDTASSTTSSWQIDLTPPANIPAVSDPGSTSTTNDIEFSWSNNADINDLKIQIATDSSFTNIVFGGSEGATLGLVENYTYAANTSEGTEYFARIKVSDASSNWSDFGAQSDGIFLVGSASINIKDTSNQTISGANVILKKISDSSVVDTQTTDSNGDVLFENVTVGDNFYTMEISAGGFSNATKNNISVNIGENSNQGIIYLAPDSASSGYFSGQVIDANDGNSIAGATIKILDWTSSIVDTKTSAANGTFTTTTLTPGTYSVKITYSGYFDLLVDNMVIDGNNALGKQSICEQLLPYHLRVVLLWGESPKDLDLHVVGPSDGTVTGDSPNNNRFHVFWKKQKSFTESTRVYSRNADPSGTFSTTSLVQDETNSYGPEAINLFKLDGDVKYAHGTYTFTVNRWNGKGSWYGSSITLRIYDSEGLWQEIPFPSGASDSDWYWQAFQVDIQGQTRAERTINIVNEFATLSYGSKDSMDWEPAAGGMAGFFLAVAHGDLSAIAIVFTFMLILLLGSFYLNKLRLKNIKDK